MYLQPYLQHCSLHILLPPVPPHSSPHYGLLSVSGAACYASCWPKMTIDCSATAFVIRLGWILHLNHFIIYVPNSCQCHLEAVWLVIHQTLSFTVVINIVMGWTFNMKLPGGMRISSGRVRLLKTGVNRGKIIRCTRYQTLSRDVVSLPSLCNLPRSSIPLLPAYTAACIFIHGLS